MGEMTVGDLVDRLTEGYKVDIEEVSHRKLDELNESRVFVYYKSEAHEITNVIVSEEDGHTYLILD